MLHLFEAVRPPIDDVERMLVDVFARVHAVEAVWVRELPRILTPRDQPGHAHKRYTRAFYVQLARRSASATAELERLGREIAVRTRAAPYLVDVRVVVDDLPPSDVAPSCVFRRSSECV